MAAEPLLEVDNLNISFAPGASAVKGISFAISRGETVGLVGESGSGKSVTSLSVMRLLGSQTFSESGALKFHSMEGPVDLNAIPEKAMRRLRGKEIAMIFQEPMTSLNPVMRCGRQVVESLRLHLRLSPAAAKKRAIELFREVQLPEPEHTFRKYPHQLSGGQKQRVMIAMAMSCNPSLLIADEPTTALDVTVQKTVLELMKSLQQKHRMGMLFITHDLGIIAEIADRVLVMYQGEIVEQGNVREVFATPKHPYTKALLACRPPLDHKPARLAVVSDFLNPERPQSGNAEKFSEARASTGEKILEVKNLSTWFTVKKNLLGRPLEYTRAVDDVTFDVYAGETLGLVGESGCGKTTLGRSILRLAPVNTGEIWFRGRNILNVPENKFRLTRREIQIVFQDPYSSLNPQVRIGDAIAEPMRVHGILPTVKARKARVAELLEKVGLEAMHYNRYPHEFSGGQRQRVCIARTLALNPKFVICDESVSALDVSVQAQVLNLLNDLKREFGFTCIFISHDLGVVKYMSDRMIVMRKGKIEEMGSAAEIYRNPQSDYTRNLIASIPQKTLERMAGPNNDIN